MNNRKLTDFDLKYITKLIGREPFELELDFIENVLSSELENRDYLEIIARLDNGASRTISNKLEIGENQITILNNLQIFDNNKLIFKGNDPDIEININNMVPLMDSYSMFNSTDRIRKTIRKSDHSVVIQQSSNIYNSHEIIFKSSICIDNDASKYDNIAEYKVFHIDFGKRIKRNLKKLDLFIEQSKLGDWIIKQNHVKGGNGSRALINLLNNINYRIKILNNSLILNNNTLNNKYVLFSIINKGNEKTVKNYCNRNDILIEELGKITKDQSIQISNKKDVLINLPLSVFDLQFDINTKHFIEPEIQNANFSEILKGVDKSSYSNQLLKLFQKINENTNCWNNSNGKLEKETKKYGISRKSSILKNQYYSVQADNNSILKISPRMSGKMAIANAGRKLSCMGVRPQVVSVNNLLPESNEEKMWLASELLQGQEEAIRELELTIGSRKINAFKEFAKQSIFVFGEQKTDSITDIGFKNDGDFISLLGSHRGELGGSEYQKYISTKTANILPSVDLNMERRLQDVVHQGINTKLIKSATNVGMGGISIAIAMSLNASDTGIGARIHLSRKLTNEELLFGETQGLVIVSLAEEDIMEFERICMTVGVPSTTIGRVTSDGLYTFNELINLKVERLKKLVQSIFSI